MTARCTIERGGGKNIGSRPSHATCMYAGARRRWGCVSARSSHGAMSTEDFYGRIRPRSGREDALASREERQGKGDRGVIIVFRLWIAFR